MNDSYASLLGRVFDATYEDERANLPAGDYERLRLDFIFHMTDWLDDLRRLNRIVEAPGSQSLEDSRHDLAGFLYHVIPHLRAAGRILVGSGPDPFEDDEAARLVHKLESGGVRVG